MSREAAEWLEGMPSSLVEQAIAFCPWEKTDHMGERRYNYCTWCEGYLAAVKPIYDLLSGRMEGHRKMGGLHGPEPHYEWDAELLEKVEAMVALRAEGE